ncbi:unnamed protein product [Moneuplotes crassus]|uniref:CTLH domain-containing protein n=1 Tax=Euplotes crassus TaxID=5936 RepID=A0AAD1UFU3_EUPCR|nr:unnamed protein product [Moneuplotes crassus]
MENYEGKRRKRNKAEMWEYYIDFHIEQIRDSVDVEKVSNDPEFIKEICENYIDIDKIKKTVLELKNIEDQCDRTNDARNKYEKLVRERDNVGVNLIRKLSFGVIKVGRTEEKKLEDFDLEHGEEIKMLKKAFEKENAKNENMIDNAILKKIDQEVKRNVDGFKEDKIFQRMKEQVKNITEASYKIRFNWDPKESRMGMTFLLVDKNDDVDKIREKFFDNAIKNPVNRSLADLIDESCEEVCFALDPQLQQESKEFLEQTKVQHFIDLIKMCDLPKVDTIILQNFYFKDEELDQILGTVICSPFERLVFKNCCFLKGQQTEQELTVNLVLPSCIGSAGFQKIDEETLDESRESKREEEKQHDTERGISIMNNDAQEGQTPPKDYINKYLKIKLPSLQKENKIEQPSPHPTKKRPLYSLSFIGCFTPESAYYSLKDGQSIDPNYFKHHVAASCAETILLDQLSLTNKINKILHKISTISLLNPMYKKRGLVSLTLKNCYLPEDDYGKLGSCFKKKWAGLETFLAFDDEK